MQVFSKENIVLSYSIILSYSLFRLLRGEAIWVTRKVLRSFPSLRPQITYSFGIILMRFCKGNLNLVLIKISLLVNYVSNLLAYCL